MTSPRIFSLVYMVVLAAVLVFGGYCVWQLWELRQEHKQLMQTEMLTQIRLAEQKELLRENQRTLERLRTDPAFVEMVIRRRLGYAKPGEVIFRFENMNEPGPIMPRPGEGNLPR